MNEKKVKLTISEATVDPDWDAFLEKLPEGDHLQSSAWAEVKASLGWRPLRLIARQNGRLVAGAQILIREMSLFGAIGCIAMGPLFADQSLMLKRTVTEALQELSREHGLQKLCLQPPVPYDGLQCALEESSFHPSSFRLMPPGTTRIDLSQSLDEILARMKARTRRNVRRSERERVVVRPGTSEDLDAYYDLVLATTNRKKFSPFPRRYYEDIWRVLHPRGYMHLLVAEVGGETVSALMLITFGASAVNKLGVWSGQHGDKRPNEAIHWAAIKLAKSLGHCTYDMGGINQPAARAFANDQPLPQSVKQTVTSFKLDFGGDVVIYPRASEFHPNPVSRFALGELYPRLQKHKGVKRAFNWLRTREAAPGAEKESGG